MSIYSHYRSGLWHPYEKPMYGVLLNPYHPLAHGLIGCWLFNEGGGNAVFDLSGFMNHGTINGATWTTGKFGSALSFNGSSDYAEVPNTDSLNPDAITVASWAKIPSFYGSGNDPLIDKAYTSHTDPYYQYHLGVTGHEYSSNQGKYRFQVSVGGTLYSADSTDTYDSDKWNFFVGTYDGETIRLYRNGVLIASNTDPSGSMDTYSTNLFIAKYRNLDDKLPADIALIYIYERALRPEEIWQLYTDPFCMFYHPLEAELLYAAPAAVGRSYGYIIG